MESKLNNIKNGEKIYNNHFLKNEYQLYFYGVINFIDSLIKKIKNSQIIPLSIKYICKIITLLINKKFPKLNSYERNLFISKFFIGKLLIPIFKDPLIKIFINNKFGLSNTTINNLNIISNILNTLFSGDFYDSNSYYSPFNIYFIEKIGEVFDIFDNLVQVKLPSIIENLIFDELSLDYEYEYFKENQNKIYNHRSFLFNTNQLLFLVNNMNQCKNKIFLDKKNEELKIILEKILSLKTKNIYLKY